MGCFGGSKKKKEGQSGASSASTSPHGRGSADTVEPPGEEAPVPQQIPKGTEVLWSPEVSFLDKFIFMNINFVFIARDIRNLGTPVLSTQLH